VSATLLGGLVIAQLAQVILLCLQLRGRSQADLERRRRLGDALDRLPAGSWYVDQDADGSVLHLEIGLSPGVLPRSPAREGCDV
jgi:hypothetical protein